MPARSMRIPPRPRLIIPTLSDTFVKIQIIDDDSVTYTILDTYGGLNDNNHLISGSITRAATDRLDNFKLKIINDGGRFLNKFDGGEVVKIFADATDATTLIFYGLIDDVSYGLDLSNGFYISIDGRAYPELTDKTIIGIEAAATADISISGILNEFYNDITFKFWNGSSWSTGTYDSDNDTVSWSPAAPDFPTTLINTTYQHKKGWDVITDICKMVGLDCYIEYDSGWVLKTFIEEDITNTGSNLAYGANILSLSDFGLDNTDIRNRVYVYGNTESDNIILLKTEDNTTSQNNLWIKDKIVLDSSLTTMTEVQDRADNELTWNTSESSGRVTSLMMPTLNPGELIHVSIPYCNVNGYYRVQEFTHVFGTVMKTTIQLIKKSNDIGDMFIPKINPDDFLNTVSNPNNMKNSYTVYFDESPSIMTNHNTEEANGKLKLQVMVTSGYAISDTLTTDYDVTTCELRRYENFATQDDEYHVSNNGGGTWEEYDIGQSTHTFASPGNQLKFKITLNRPNYGDTSPTYDAICLLYKP